MKRIRLFAVLASVAVLGACASAPIPPAQAPRYLFEDSAFEAPSRLVNAAEVFELSPAMQHYLEVEIRPQLRSMGVQRGLVDALRNKAQLQIVYDTDSTRTAAEAFDARAGNCLSLVVMTAALAKHLGLPTQYQAVTGQETWSRSGDLSIVNGHVSIVVARRLIDHVALGDFDTQLRLDFGALPAARGSRLHVVGENTIVSMFMNNRAAEALVRDEVANAYAYAREAVLQDPSYAGAYNTLGVVYTRHGLVAAAERAYRHALERDGSHLAAMFNLTRLLDGQGRTDEAATWRSKLAQLEVEPPFHYFDLGRSAAQAGDFRTARELILREMRRDPEYHEFHFWLAVALYGLGEVDQAREHLSTAMKNSTTRREQSLYASKLQRLTPAAVRNQ